MKSNDLVPTVDDRLSIVETRRCVEDGCGKAFHITKGNKDFFESKGMPLPKRCEACRLRRRTSIKGNIEVPVE